MSEKLELKNKTDSEVKKLLQKHNIGLTVAEARKIEKEILGRPMTLTEAVAWGIEGSEHCSYKTSKKFLKKLPTSGPNVILGPEEDAGIVEIARHDGVRYGIVIGHESHNHPSQIVPYEGAATGIGGIVRDICCMGAKVIAVADPLRFGKIDENKTKWIADGVVSGIGGYGNPIGVPNIAGDVYFNDSFNENCLVNVVALGLIQDRDIIHSHAPENADGYDLILVGKPTDNSGFGGASFASFELDEKDKEKNKGAVQEPNAFLKRHLLESTLQLFSLLKEKKLLAKVGFKDLGAGGVLCASVEMADSGGYGAEIDVDKIHVGMEDLPPQVILAAETQERFMWVAHPDVTPLILKHYNEIWALSQVSKGAQASVIGNIRDGGQYTVHYKGMEKVIDCRACDLTEGLIYDRPYESPQTNFDEPDLSEPEDYHDVFFKLLSHENIADRSAIYERYDKSVQGITVIEPGKADAGVMKPLIDEDVPEAVQHTGLALSVDSNPLYSRLSPYWGAVNAVVESFRNVAAVGASPQAITDCLNYGNPEKPTQMWQFTEGVRGISEVCRGIHLKEYPDAAVPVVSGNVSFYNESKVGAVDPSAIIACLGKLPDYRKAITMEFKEADSQLFLIGERKDELGGSVYYQLFDELGANVPQPDFATVEHEVHAVVDMIDQGLLLACHDISDGGLAVALAEMSFGGDGKNRIGIDIDLSVVTSRDLSLPIFKKLFSETGGFVLETKQADKVRKIAEHYNIALIPIGKTTYSNKLVVKDGDTTIINQPIEALGQAWLGGLRDKLT